MLLSGTLCVASCRAGGSADVADTDSTAFHFPDTLRVGTLYSPTSYFIYREEKMGYDYDLVRQLASDKSMAIDLHVAPSLGALMAMLDSGLIDVAAYEIPVTAEYRDRVIPTGPENITTQVLVQPVGDKSQRITDVTQLAGKEVYVEKGSKYQHRLVNLNDEIGGGIVIHTVDRDTMISEDMIDMVSNGTIPLAIVDSDVARLNANYYKASIDASLQVSFPQRASWGVSVKKPWLADSINAWMASAEPRKRHAALLKRYFELSKSSPAPVIDLSKGHISPYDHLFRRYAEGLDWDWRILAAQGFAESRFDTAAVSWAGARGIMQIMPGTARANGLSQDEITDPERNIATAVKIMQTLDKNFSRSVPDPSERQKFVLAAYHSGMAHVLDAIALARKYGRNPQIWDGNVAETIIMKSNPEYYNDPVCKYGYFRGRETATYVERIMDFYHTSRRSISR